MYFRFIIQYDMTCNTIPDHSHRLAIFTQQALQSRGAGEGAKVPPFVEKNAKIKKRVIINPK